MAAAAAATRGRGGLAAALPRVSFARLLPARYLSFACRLRTTHSRRGAPVAVMKAVGTSHEQAVCWPTASRAMETFVDAPDAAVTVEPVQTGKFSDWLSLQPAESKEWVANSKFKAKSGEVCMLPSREGGIERVLLGVESTLEIWAYAALPSLLPKGSYKIAEITDPDQANKAAIGWALGTYCFERYKKPIDDKPTPRLEWPLSCNRSEVTTLIEGIFMVRDMINTPAENMGPGEIAAEALALAAHHNAKANVIIGDDLLTSNFPAIHTVGRASNRAPRIVDVQWSGPGHPSTMPRVALVGKGVAFDTGGLNIKTTPGMQYMKKDMGGAALVIGLAHVIMANQLPVILRLLVPTVDNAISGNAYRPKDVLQTRSGITVENGNTDAEGRLILCDAMYEAAEDKPDILIDVATLTGAARVALGPSLPALFSSDNEVAEAILKAGKSEDDPLWQLPLHKEYRKMLDSKVADIASIGESGLGGAIIAALFLNEFVKDIPQWIHIDTNGWNTNGRGHGRPEGGEALALRALWKFLKNRYGS